MKKYLKPSLIFIIVLLIYLLPGFLFKAQPEYYNQLTKPSYAPPAILFGIAWPILFILFSIIITKKIVQNSLKLDQVIYFIINYFLIFFFNKIFFIDKNLFFTLMNTLLCFISGLFLFVSLFKEDKLEALLILPFILWTAFATILMTNIYFLQT